jgi:hypothetical protein
MTPDFQTLPILPGHPTYRLVGNLWMDAEEYTVCGWQLVKTYTRDDGTKSGYWAASLDGLRRYGQILRKRREDRIAAAVNRRDQDDEWSSHVQSLIEERGNR